jgi:hypothetical protein
VSRGYGARAIVDRPVDKKEVELRDRRPCRRRELVVRLDDLLCLLDGLVVTEREAGAAGTNLRRQASTASKKMRRNEMIMSAKEAPKIEIGRNVRDDAVAREVTRVLTQSDHRPWTR